MKLEDLGKELLFFDGGMGTCLQEKGLEAGQLPELWNFSHPEVIEEIHLAYLAAGSDIVTTNTFGANRFKLKNSGHSVKETVVQGVSLAKKAADQYGKGLVALDIGPTGKLLAPLGELEFEEAASVFREMVEAGAEAKADCIIIETMSDLYEVKAALLAAKEYSSLPVFVTMTYDAKGRLLTGGTIEAAAALLEGLGADAIGMNCGLGPQQMIPLTAILRKHTSLPILVNPNAGLPEEIDGKIEYRVHPKEFAEAATEIIKAGACVVGGCCGTTPEHIRQLTLCCKQLLCPALPNLPGATVVTTGRKAVAFGKKLLLLGDQMNPEKKEPLAQAIQRRDVYTLVDEGLEQQDNGADILTVTAELASCESEESLLSEVVKELQAVSDLPLLLKSHQIEELEKALRLYNGSPMVYVRSSEDESFLSSVFSLAKKYAAVLFYEITSKDGAARDYLEAAQQFLQKAHQMGIPEKNIVISLLGDPFTQENVLLQVIKILSTQYELTLAFQNSVWQEEISETFLAKALESGLWAVLGDPALLAGKDCFIL